MSKFFFVATMSSGGKFFNEFINKLPGFTKIKIYGDFPAHHQNMYIDKIVKEHPNHKILHLIRDGRDSVCSRFYRKHGEDKLSSIPKKELTDEEWNKLKKHQKYACVWKWSMEVCEKYKDNPNYFEFKYEDLVNQPQITLGRIYKFLDVIVPEEKTEEFIKKIKRNGLNRRAQYPKYLVDEVETIIKHQLKRLGYKNEM